MSVYRFCKPLLFSLPPEQMHTVAISGLRSIQGTPIERALLARYSVTDPRLRVDAFGLQFSNPVGVAAGFDKNAQIPRALASLGFGHVEIGGVTAHEQPGNERPRLFRLPPDRALINRMGFNNHGADRIAARLDATSLPPVPIGINIGKSKKVPLDTAETDYRYSYEKLAPYGDFFVVNVSSPNTPGVRRLQDETPLTRIITTLQDAGAQPLLVKLSPDLTDEAVKSITTAITDLGVHGIIATNTTTSRKASLLSPNKTQSGGLSGKPLESRSTEVVRLVAQHTDLPIIGVGGVFTAADAYRKLRAGASLIQLYTGLIYEGPAIARQINTGLIDLLERDGFTTVADAIGADIE